MFTYLLLKKPVVRGSFLTAVCFVFLVAVPVNAKTNFPFEKFSKYKTYNEIDTIVSKELQSRNIKPANLSSDEIFMRRIYLDVTGTLPEPAEIAKFLENPRPNKRSTLVNTLLKSEEYADYWSLKWCDLLRVKAEFPINLWPNAVQAYHRWIHDALINNMPYDEFATEMLTASGSNFRVPQVNFYRAMQGQDAESIASAVALTFMGVRIENWPEDRRNGMEAFFSRVGYKGTAEWKEQIVYLNPESTESLMLVFPDGKNARVKSGDDPRAVFTEWLTKPGNEWFARNIVNRIWAWLLGRGIIHEPDDIRPDNPAVYPELLAYLEKELVGSGYDLQHIYRLILNSRTYQQSPIPQTDNANAEELFACYPVRQLDAEVLIDALCKITGTKEKYSSPIPEPFTFIPPENRSIELADGSITSQFLEMFGRPSRDTGMESERSNTPTDTQRRHLLNSTHIQNKIERSWRFRNLTKYAKKNNARLTRSIYMTILSRNPTEAEMTTAAEYFKTPGIHPNQATVDLAWALINSKEFLYKH
jgi:hypothetical protein